jgi:uncharacterized protein (DUF2249 family)
MKPRAVLVDARGMEPPEPLERVLEAVADFEPGDRLTLVTDCEPLPLYRILQRNGFRHHAHPGVDSLYEIAIWRED